MVSIITLLELYRDSLKALFGQSEVTLLEDGLRILDDGARSVRGNFNFHVGWGVPTDTPMLKSVCERLEVSME